LRGGRGGEEEEHDPVFFRNLHPVVLLIHSTTDAHYSRNSLLRVSATSVKFSSRWTSSNANLGLPPQLQQQRPALGWGRSEGVTGVVGGAGTVCTPFFPLSCAFRGEFRLTLAFFTAFLAFSPLCAPLEATADSPALTAILQPSNPLDAWSRFYSLQPLQHVFFRAP
jgi:hypothetical protein